MNIIKNLRGTADEWAKNDCVIPDGTFALEKHENGFYGIKIGNGTEKFSDLPSLTGTVKNSVGTECIVAPENGIDYRFGDLSSLTLENPSSICDSFYSELSFDSLSTSTTVIYNISNVFYSGSNVENNVFVPEIGTHYTMLFWYDGRMNCHIRGVKIA